MQSMHVPSLSYQASFTSYASSGRESVFLKPKQITGPDFYDRSNLSRVFGLFGVVVAALFGAACVVGGYLIFRSKNSLSAGIMVVSVQNGWEKELISLALNLVVTISTEATGFVHGIGLRGALASEQRLDFNTNLRLFSSVSGVFNPNGTPCNLVMALLLIVSYSSSLLVTLSVNMDSSSNVPDKGVTICASEVPLIVLGITLLLQAIIALTSIWNVEILTWSSSPFDITAALVSNLRIAHQPGRSMYGVGNNRHGAVKPSPKQASAWRAHASVKKVVITILVLAIACTVWGVVAMRLSNRRMSDAVKSWTFFPQPQSHVVVAYSIPITNGVYWYWALYYLNMLCIQGPLTLALHCCELIANVLRDERMWRKATTRGGTTVSTDPVTPILMYPLNLVLFLLKPVLHWMLGLAISLAGTASNGYLSAIAVSMWPLQILNYAAALFVFSVVLLVVVLWRPRGPQPAAYGHVRTLANLMDEWSPTFWWGDKGAGFDGRRAGTSDRQLPEVEMGASYA